MSDSLEMALEEVTRIVVVGKTRELEVYDVEDVILSLQDDHRTLKIFYRKEDEVEF